MASEKIASTITEHEMYELKQAAMKYYTENGVTEKMEEVLNGMFFANPEDVYGHLSTFFSTFSRAPTISGLTGYQALDSKGEPALQVDVYGKVKNFDKLLSRTTISNSSRLNDLWKIEDKEAEDQRRLESITEAINYLSDQIRTKLFNTELRDQTGVDEVTYTFIDDIRMEKEDELAREMAGNEAQTETTDPQASTVGKKAAKSPKGKKSPRPVVITPDPPAELQAAGRELVSAVSMGVCQAAASAFDQPLYEYIASLRHKGEGDKAETPEKLHLPLPVITILQGGKSCPGKQNCVKEYMLTTCPGSTLSDGLQKIRAIQSTVFKTLFAKAGAPIRNVSETGAIVTALDRPEQGLDVIQDAANQLGFVAGTDYNIILNLSAKDIFDYEKGRYEVMTGQLKLAEELVEFYADIVSKYPSVVGLVDPIRAVEKSAWYKLGEKISEHCYLFDAEGHDRPGKYRHAVQFIEHFNASGVVFQYDEMATVTHLIQCFQVLKERNQKLMLSTSLGETSDTFLTDMAVGLGADFYRVGGLNRGERINKLNRLLQIESELSSQNRLDTNPEHQFPKISSPEMPPTPEVPDEGVVSNPSSPRK